MILANWSVLQSPHPENVIDLTKLYQRVDSATRVIKMIFHSKLSYLFNKAMYIRMMQVANVLFGFDYY